MTSRNDRSLLTTETPNRNSRDLDRRSIREVLEIIHGEDRKVAEAVGRILGKVERVVEMAVKCVAGGGRVFYVGAGTSGRLGALDAAECPPTFSVPTTWFQGIIAGGRRALTRSIEGAEDSAEAAVQDLRRRGLTERDVVIGIASSGTTPYVCAALRFARKKGCRTAFIICNPRPLAPIAVDVLVAVRVGTEVLTGSTRMKSGTATKMILNMISTATMIRLGKVYGNLMVDLRAVNQKLADRGTRILMEMTGRPRPAAAALLRRARMEVKTAIVMHARRCGYSRAKSLLKRHNGFLRPLLESPSRHRRAPAN